MKVLNLNKSVSKSLILSLITVVLVMFYTVSISVAEFEVGTQFGYTRVSESDGIPSSLSILQIPSGEISSVGASPYLTFFPHKHFAFSPEFNFQQVTTSWGESSSDSESALYLGSKFYYFLVDHAVSNPYFFFKGSIGNIADQSLTHVGIGVGYQWQWHIIPVYFFRLEGQYHRQIVDGEQSDSMSVMIGIGIRFGNSE